MRNVDVDSNICSFASARTLVSVGNTRVFRTALTALTEPCTPRRSITRYSSLMRPLALHTYSLTLWWRVRTIRKTCVLHSSQGLQLCWSHLHNAWRCQIIATNSSTDFKTYACSLYSHLCCIYTASDLHTEYLDWQHVVIVSNSRCAWRWRLLCTPSRSVHLRYPCISVHQPSLINELLGGHDRASLKTHFEAVIERVWKCIWRPRLSKLRDTPGGRDRASLEMQFQSRMERT